MIGTWMFLSGIAYFQTAIYVLREGTLYSKRLYNRCNFLWPQSESDTDTKASTTKGSLLGFCKQRNVGDQFSLVNLILRPSKSRSLIWLLLQSRNLTKMHPKMRAWKMIFPFKEVIFRSHVSFWGSRSTQLLHLRRIVKCSKQKCFKCKKSCTQWHPICLCYVLLSFVSVNAIYIEIMTIFCDITWIQ